MKSLSKSKYNYALALGLFLACFLKVMGDEGMTPASLYPYINDNNKIEVSDSVMQTTGWFYNTTLSTQSTVSQFSCLQKHQKTTDYLASFYLKIGENYKFGLPESDSLIYILRVNWECKYYEDCDTQFVLRSHVLRQSILKVKITPTEIIQFSVDTLLASFQGKGFMSLNITSCTLELNSSISSPLKDNINNSIYFGMSIDTKVKMLPPFNPTFCYVNYYAKDNKGFFSHYIDTNKLQPLRLSWNIEDECTADSAPLYHVQILKIYNYNSNIKSPNDPINEIRADWDKAINLYVSGYKTFTDVVLTEGYGYYVWRVRPIGNYYPGGAANNKNWGEWAGIKYVNTYIPISPYLYSNSGAQTFSLGDPRERAFLFVNGYDNNINWQHSRAFTDDAQGGTKVFDKITHMDNLLKPRQAQSRLSSDNSTIVSYSFCDFMGRNSIAPLAYPERDFDIVDSNITPTKEPTGLDYKYDPLQKNFTQYIYDSHDRFQNRIILSPLELGRAVDYYDGNFRYEGFEEINSESMKIPSSQGYPYVKNTYKEDGTNRILETTLLGGKSIKNDTELPQYRSTKVYYSSVSYEELWNILGPQMPKTTELSKTSVKDANGVVTISYLDQNNKPIATCIDRLSGSQLDTLNHAKIIDYAKPINYIIDRLERISPSIYSDSKAFSQEINNQVWRVKFEDSLDLLQNGKIILPCLGFEAPVYIPYVVKLFVNDDYTLNATKSEKYNFLPTTAAWSNEIIHTQKSNPKVNTTSIDNLPEGIYTGSRIIDFKRSWALDSLMPFISSRIKENLDSGFTDVYSYVDRFFSENQMIMNDELLVDFYKMFDTDPNWHKFPENSTLEHHNISFYYKTLNCGDTIKIPYRYCGITCYLDVNDYENYLKQSWGPRFYDYSLDGLDKPELMLNGVKETIDTAALHTYFYCFDRHADTAKRTYPAAEAPYVNQGNGAFNRLIHNMLTDTANNGYTNYTYSSDTLCDCWRRTVEGGFEMAFEYDSIASVWKPNPDFDLLNEFLDCAGRRISGFAPRNNYYDSIPATGESFAQDVKFGYGYLTYAYKSFPYDAFADNNGDWNSCENVYGYNYYIQNNRVIPLRHASTPVEWRDFSTCQLTEMKFSGARKKMDDMRKEMEDSTKNISKNLQWAGKLDYPQCIQDALMGYTIIDTTCIKAYRDSLELKCRLRCDSLGFRQNIIAQILNADGYIQGNTTWNGNVLDTSSIVYIPDDLYPQYIRLKKADDTIHFDIEINKYFKLEEINNYVIALTNHCKCDCELTIDQSIQPTTQDPFALLRAMGTEEERRRISIVMSWQYDIGIKKLPPDFGTAPFYLCPLSQLYDCGPEDNFSFIGKPFIPSDWQWEVLKVSVNSAGYETERVFYDYVASRLNRRLDSIKNNLNALSYDKAYLFADSSIRKSNYLGLSAEMYALRTQYPVSFSSTCFPYLPGLDYQNGIVSPQSSFNDSTLYIPYLNPVTNSLESILTTTAYGLSYNFFNTTGIHRFNRDVTSGIRNDEWTFFPKDRLLKIYGFRRDEPCVIDSAWVKYDDIFSAQKDENNHYAIFLSRLYRYDDPQDAYKLRFAPFTTSLKFIGGPIIYNDSNWTVCNTLCFRWRPATAPANVVDNIVTCGKTAFQDILNSVMDQYDAMTEKLENEAISQFDGIFNRLIDSAAAQRKCNLTLTKTISYIDYTLYYYDRAGNLQYTVPPEGVETHPTNWRIWWQHKYVSNEIRNTAGKLLSRQSPEEKAREEIFIYDGKNRIRFSQNAEQALTNLYTYYSYDQLGRLVETGELQDQGFDIVNNTKKSRYLNDWWPTDQILRTGYTKYVFDAPYVGVDSVYKQKFLRNRLSYATRYNPVTPGVPVSMLGEAWDPVSTIYSYDFEGRVQCVLQVIPHLNSHATYVNEFLKPQNSDIYTLKYITGAINYEYDYVSGNINMIIYNKNVHIPQDYEYSIGFEPDNGFYNINSRFFQKYEYDSDNRLVAVYSSRDSVIWERDAKYQFYPHGPLRAGDIGTDGLTRNEYTYTIDGWAKTMNGHSADLGEVYDSDGRKTAKSPFGYNLNYYENDFVHDVAPKRNYLMPEGTSLYNGTIVSGEFSYNNPDNIPQLNAISLPSAFKYTYDKLYRLKSSKFFTHDGLDWAEQNSFGSVYKYDLNGNLLNQKTYKNNGGVCHDYKYTIDGTSDKPSNKLTSIKDSLDFMFTRYFHYNEIGSIIQDEDPFPQYSSTVSNMKWTYDGKLSMVMRDMTDSIIGCNNTTIRNDIFKLRFLYDASGNRVAELMDMPLVIQEFYDPETHTYKDIGNCFKALNVHNTYYIRRENGDIMSVYRSDYVPYQFVSSNYLFPSFPGIILNNKYQKDHRVPTQRPQPGRIVEQLRQVEWDVYAGAKDGRLAVVKPDTLNNYQTLSSFYRPMLHKTYEMKDWLGSPRLTFSDVKGPVDPTALDTNDYEYKLVYLSGTTTYPFGAQIDTLSFENPSYRFGFTGHLKDNLIRPKYGDGANYSTLFREYDPIIGRWWSIDPLRAKYAGMSPYNYAAGNPINAVDKDGREPVTLTFLLGKAAIGALIGGGTDLAAQIAIHMNQGKSFNDALDLVDWTSVGTSAFMGALSIPGVSTGTRLTATAITTGYDMCVDYTLKEGETNIFFGTKTLEKAAMDGIFSVVGEGASSYAANYFRAGIKADINSKAFSTFDPHQQKAILTANSYVEPEGGIEYLLNNDFKFISGVANAESEKKKSSKTKLIPIDPPGSSTRIMKNGEEARKMMPQNSVRVKTDYQ